MRLKKNEFYKKTIFLVITIFFIIIILLKISRDIIKNEIVNFLQSQTGNEFFIQIVNSKIEYLAERELKESEIKFYKNNLIKIKDKFKFLLDE
jgi:5-bromo-4-chloroindolyl phosphate hydrolysis protein